MPINFDTTKFIERFLTHRENPNSRPLVTAVAMGVPVKFGNAGGGDPVAGSFSNDSGDDEVPAAAGDPKIVILAEPAADCELQSVWNQAKEANSNDDSNIVILPTSRFVGQQAPPALSGASIGARMPNLFNVPEVSAGTFGAVVEAGGKRYVLGSNHVMAFNGRVPLGTPIVSPGTLDNPHAFSHVANLTGFVELQHASWPINLSPANRVDAAFARIRPGAVVPASTLVTPGVPASGSVTPVQKNGRTTGKTKGALCLWNIAGYIDLSFGTFYFTDLLGVIGANNDPFAAPGDSGALVTDTHGRGIGLVVARAFSPGAYVPQGGTAPPPNAFGGYIVLVCSLEAVLDSLADRLKMDPKHIQFAH